MKSSAHSLLRLKSFLIVLLFTIIYTQPFAQPTAPQTVDIIYMKDGRVLRGEILIFEEKDGDITFLDTYGRKYSITREEYKYFEENQVVKDRRSKKDTLLRERKENEFEFSVGLSYGWYNPSSSFTPDELYLQNFNNNSFHPINLHAGAGKYFNRKHFIGINGEYSIISGASPVINLNGRYAFQYDAYKKNTACYIPVELGYTSLNNFTSFFVADSTTFNDYRQVDYDVKTSAFNVGLGHGFNFMLKNKHSFALEVLLYKYFILSESLQGEQLGTPTFSTSPIGGKLAFYINI